MTIRVLRSALSLCSAGGLLLGANAWGQASPPAGNAAPAAADAKPAQYADRVLDDGPQPVSKAEEETDTSGWARGWSVELQSTQQKSYYTSRNQSALFSGYLDTPNYGALSANINLTRDSNPIDGFAVTNLGGGTTIVTPYGYNNTSTWRFDQRALPLNNGWYANNALGNINMSSTAMSRGIGRVMLPNAPIEGGSTVVEQVGRTSFNASAGRLGYYDGVQSQGFSLGRGSAIGAGAQTLVYGDANPSAPNRVDAAVQVIDARDFNGYGITGYAQNTRSVWSAASWQGIAPWADNIDSGYGNLYERVGGMRVQANVVHSAGQPSDALSLAPRDAANGAWIDAAWRGAWLQQAVSAFTFDPSLRWGADPLPSDLRGVSWRGDVSTRQWQLGTYLELSDSITGITERSLFGNVFGRYRFDSRDAISSTLAARSGTYAAQSLQVTWEHQSQFGYTQWKNEVAKSTVQRAWNSTVDHTWNVGEAYTLSTSLGLEQLDTEGYASARAVDWGIVGTTPFVMGSRLDLNLRGTQGINGNGRQFLNANARLSWPVGLGWSFIAQVSASNGRESLDPTVVSALEAATINPVILQPSNRAFLIALRYEGRAGSSMVPIGGSAGMGSGRLEGSVYFDQDANGRREASEGGVPNVTVILDKRYVARTDAQGRYSFPAVASGNHEIEVVQDNLPLPWSSPGASASRRVDIFVRSTAVADFPIQRDR